MIVQDRSGALCLNTAIVPRIKSTQNGDTTADSEQQHQFTVVEFEGTNVTKVESTWVAVAGDTLRCRTVSTQPLMRQSSAGLQLWDAFDESWVASAVVQPA